MKLSKAILVSLVLAVPLIGAASAHASPSCEPPVCYEANLNAWHATGLIDFSRSNTTVELPESARFLGVFKLNLQTGKGSIIGFTGIPEFSAFLRLDGVLFHPTFRFVETSLSEGTVLQEGQTISFTLNQNYMLSIPESSLGIENTTKVCTTKLTQSLSQTETLEEFDSDFDLGGNTTVSAWTCGNPHGEGNSAQLSSVMTSALTSATNPTVLHIFNETD
jgi:hypothetical protein